MSTKAHKIGHLFIEDEPFYLPLRDEVELFESAYRNRIPALLKEPTGCGKTRFVQYMAWKLGRPLITIACHDDLTASDLVGRYRLNGRATHRSRQEWRHMLS